MEIFFDNLKKRFTENIFSSFGSTTKVESTLLKETYSACNSNATYYPPDAVLQSPPMLPT